MVELLISNQRVAGSNPARRSKLLKTKEVGVDLVKQMRVFESDHEPDGWPAIQMKQVSALCDEIERLQSIIDEANAQEPFGHVVKENGSLCDFVTVNQVNPGCYSLYRRPVPAQQSVDRQSIIDVLLASGNLSEGVTADLIISAIGAQQSPEKTEYVPISYDMKSVFIDGFGLLPIQYPGDQQSPAVADTYQRVVQLWNSNADKYNQWESLGEDEKIEFSIRCGISTRITEQDAREIYGVIRDIVQSYECGDEVDSKLRPLLAKLNEVNNEKAN